MSLLELFCAVHDFCGVFQPRWQTELLTHRVHRRRRERPLDRREIMLILIHFHQSHYRDFKAFYTHSVLGPLRAEFPGLVSYTRFVEFIPSVLIPLGAYRRYGRGTCTGISFVDSTDLTVGPTRRIAQHKVLKGLAEGGQTSTGWFFGFKVHFGFHDRGEWWDGTLTAGKVDDRTPVPHLVKRWFGKRVGAKGYMARKLQDELRETWRVQLITKLKRNMKNQLMPLADRLLLRKRAMVETILDQLKNTLAPHASAGVSPMEHSRHRSLANFRVNLLCGLIVYCHQPKKPSLHLEDLPALPA